MNSLFIKKKIDSFDNKLNMDRRIVTISLPFKVSVRDYVKFKNDEYNINNNIKSSYVNKTTLMIPHSKLIELDKLLPIFSSRKENIKKLIEYNKNLNIESFYTTKIYIRESNLLIGMHQYEISTQIINYVELYNLGMVYVNTAIYILPNGNKRKPGISFIRYTKWNLIDPLIKYNGIFPYYSPDFIIEIRLKNDTLEFIVSKMIEYILSGTQSALLIDPHGNSGCCYYYCKTPSHNYNSISASSKSIKSPAPLIENSIPLIDHNLNQTGVNYIEYSWSNLSFTQGYFPQLKIPLVGYLNGLILDLSKIKRLE